MSILVIWLTKVNLWTWRHRNFEPQTERRLTCLSFVLLESPHRFIFEVMVSDSQIAGVGVEGILSELRLKPDTRMEPEALLVPSLARVRARLSCPLCLTATQPTLDHGPAGLACSRCGSTFPVRDGVPILLSPAFTQMRDALVRSKTGRAMIREYAAVDVGDASTGGHCAGDSGLGPLARFRPPALMLHTDPDLTGPETRRLFDHAGPSTIVLNLGGGPRRYRPTEVTLNLDAFVNVDVVGDAHRIPFLSDTFDTVLCNAVLEHVADPETVVAEAIRVLKPGGKLYAEVPFIFFFHGYPNDFRRYTLEGMRVLFSGLSQPHFGITNGPVSATLQSVNTLLQLVIPPRARWALRLARGLFGWTVFPLKYLDRRVCAREDAHILAGGFYVLGSKPMAKTTLADPHQAD